MKHRGYRKIEGYSEGHLKSETDRILILEGARPVGKSFIIRKVGERLYKNFIAINFVKDDEGPQLFKEIRTTEEFYFIWSSIHGKDVYKRQSDGTARGCFPDAGSILTSRASCSESMTIPTLKEVPAGWPDRKSTRLNSSHSDRSRMPSSA